MHSSSHWPLGSSVQELDEQNELQKDWRLQNDRLRAIVVSPLRTTPEATKSPSEVNTTAEEPEKEPRPIKKSPAVTVIHWLGT
jgi:hypothetical protein